MRSRNTTALLIGLATGAMALAAGLGTGNAAGLTRPGPVPGGMGLKLPYFAREIKCVPGAWAEYKVQSPPGARPMHIKMGCPGFQRTKQGLAWWLEIAGTYPGGGAYAMRVLVRGSFHSPKAILKTILKLGKMRAFEVPRHMVRVSGAFKKGPTTLPAGLRLGRSNSTVATKAGSFRCEVYHVSKAGREVGRYHLNRDLRPLAIVKVVDQRLRMELVARGRHYKTAITQAPAKLDFGWLRNVTGIKGRKPTPASRPASRPVGKRRRQ